MVRIFKHFLWVAIALFAWIPLHAMTLEEAVRKALDNNPQIQEAKAEIAAIRNNPVMVGRLSTFDDYFADSVGRIGLLGEQSERALATENLIMKQLHDMRQSISGVNIDEELANMIRYQHGYNAAARFITTVNSMLETLLRMGAV